MDDGGRAVVLGPVPLCQTASLQHLEQMWPRCREKRPPVVFQLKSKRIVFVPVAKKRRWLRCWRRSRCGNAKKATNKLHQKPIDLGGEHTCLLPETG